MNIIKVQEKMTQERAIGHPFVPLALGFTEAEAPRN